MNIDNKVNKIVDSIRKETKGKCDHPLEYRKWSSIAGDFICTKCMSFPD